MENANINEAFENLEKRAESNATVNNDDYIGDDGLLYCGRCHTKKQCRVGFPHPDTIRTCTCRCETERIKKEKAEAEAENRLRSMKADAFLNNRRADDMQFRNSTVETTAMQAARDYARNLSVKIENGIGRIFAGDKGTGKTFAATCILNDAIEHGYSCKSTSFSQIERELSAPRANKCEVMDKLVHYDLILLDDLGVERNTPYMQQIVYDVVDALYKAKKAILITTNLTPVELSARDCDSGRIYERILEDSDIVECNGDSLRI